MRQRIVIAAVLAVLPACAYRGGLGPDPMAGGNANEDVGRRPLPAPVYAGPVYDPRIQPAEVDIHNDEFTGARAVVFTTGVEWEGQTRMPPGARFLLIAHPGTGDVHISIASSFDTWRWLRCNRLHVLVDDERVALGEPEHQGDVRTTARSSYVHESVSTNAPGLAERLLHVRSFRGRVCNDVFAIPEAALDELRRVPVLAAELRWVDDAQPPTTSDGAGE